MVNETNITLYAPDILQPILDKIRENSTNNRTEQTPKDKVKQRVGPGGKTLDYVSWIDVCYELDKKYPGWSYEIVGEPYKLLDYINVPCRLKIIDSGVLRTFDDYGTDSIKIKDDGSPASLDYMKNCMSDGIKRCAAKLGLFNDLYTKEVIGDVSITTRTNEEWQWFFSEVDPILADKISIEKLDYIKYINIIEKFKSGELTKEKLIEVYQIKEQL